jgi:Na+-transporting NADH:ubiquinone oxidoreductase subunit NqrE
MPLTPLHGLSLMFLYFKDKRRIDPLALTASATFIDLEPLYYTLLEEALDHRIWHSFAVALTVYPLLIMLGVYIVERLLNGRLHSIYNALGLRPNQVVYPLLTIYFCSLIGGLSHVFFDMLTHKDMPYVIFPLTNGNPFYLGQASITAELAVILLTAYSLLQWLKR